MQGNSYCLGVVFPFFVFFLGSRQNWTESATLFVYDKHAATLYFVFTKKGRIYMKEISKEYLLLFNTITDVEECLRQLRAKLVAAQQQAESLFLEETDPTDASRTA